MNYRDSLTNDIKEVPESMDLSPREQLILAYDIRAYEEELKPHWRSVAILLKTEKGLQETKASCRGVYRRFMEKIRKQELKALHNDLLSDNMLVPSRDVSIAERKTEMVRQWLGTDYISSRSLIQKGKKRRVCVVSDYHGTVHPFIAQSLLKEEYDLCIHAGDILDMWSLHQSRIEGKSLTQQEKVVTLDEEIATMRAWFELLDEKTQAQHIVLMGNHDARLYSLFVKLLDPYLRSESLLCRMVRTPLELLTEGLENFTIGSRQMNWVYPDFSVIEAANSQYLYQLGDALISHMNFTGKQSGAAVSKLWSWVQDYRHNLELSNIRLCLQAHTHSLMLDKNAQGGHVHLVETGCALEATALGYGLVYNGNWTPSAVGYVLFDQYEEESGIWKSDLNSIELKGVG